MTLLFVHQRMGRILAKFFAVITMALLLAGCDDASTETGFSRAPAPAFNGVWASNCVFNPTSGYFETTDYDIRDNNAGILITSYQDGSCNQFITEELYEGSVTQTGSVILGNGLEAAELYFSAYDSSTATSISYTSYFNAGPFTLYEYPNPSSNFVIEFDQVL